MKIKFEKMVADLVEFSNSRYSLAQCRLHFVSISQSAFSSHVSVRVGQASPSDPGQPIYPSNA